MSEDIKALIRTEVMNGGVEMEESLEHFERADDISYQMFYLGQIMGVAQRIQRVAENCAKVLLTIDVDKKRFMVCSVHS